jgi:hypothetical protein
MLSQRWRVIPRTLVQNVGGNAIRVLIITALRVRLFSSLPNVSPTIVSNGSEFAQGS